MTIGAQCGAGVVLDKEFTELVIVRIMAGSALELLIVVETHFVSEGSGIAKLAVGRDQGCVIGEGNGVIV